MTNLHKEAERAVFFDFGGVLMRTEFQAPRQKLAERFLMDYDQIDQAVFGGESARQASVGEISENEHWEAVLKRLRQPPSALEAFRGQFFGGDIIDRQLAAYIRDLRGKCQTGLISNAWSGLRALLEKEGLLALFDTVIISAEVGTVKPGRRIYEMALEGAQVAASRAVFVDDMPQNIAGCEEVGMKGILFRETEQTMAGIEAFLSEE